MTVGTLARVMPTYEYACKNCGHRFEVVRSMRDEPLTVCPECGGELRKVFAPPAIAFKGSGFYATDHGKKSQRSASTETAERGEKKEKKDTGSSESGSSSGTDSKSEASSPKEPTTT
jgi:putative FmdB family regulatory protein